MLGEHGKGSDDTVFEGGGGTEVVVDIEVPVNVSGFSAYRSGLACVDEDIHI